MDLGIRPPVSWQWSRQRPGQRPGRWSHATLLALSAVIAGCGDAGGPQGGQGQQPPPPQVATETVALQQVEVTEQYAGRVVGARKVEVRARVEGIVSRRTYTEGAVVEAGAQLFTIDPEPYGVALARAQAERQRAQASVRQAERDWERISALYQDDAISTRERDQAQSALELARAELAVAEAAVRSAEIELGYTTVEAPVSGVTSLEVLPEGGLANRGDLLTTVTQLDPVHVRFSLPEGNGVTQSDARQAIADGANADRRDAVLMLGDGERYEHTGQVDFTEAGIDPATGTVRARAVFPNPDRVLRPGLFVRIEMRTATLQDVAVVPEQAIASSGAGPSVFVVGPDDAVHATPVELGPVVPAGQVVANGLSEGDRVVVSGLAGLQDGMKVDASGAGERP